MVFSSFNFIKFKPGAACNTNNLSKAHLMRDDTSAAMREITVQRAIE